jgi:hypothetical protein
MTNRTPSLSHNERVVVNNRSNFPMFAFVVKDYGKYVELKNTLDSTDTWPAHLSTVVALPEDETAPEDVPETEDVPAELADLASNVREAAKRYGAALWRYMREEGHTLPVEHTKEQLDAACLAYHNALRS